MRLLEKTIKCYIGREWTKGELPAVKKMLAAYLLEEILTFEVAKIGVKQYRESRISVVQSILDILRVDEIVPRHISHKDAQSLINLYFSRQYDPNYDQPVTSGENKCEWPFGCPSSKGKVGAIKEFHRDHIIPRCSSNLGADPSLFDPHLNSQQLCSIHNVSIKKENIALGAVIRKIIK